MENPDHPSLRFRYQHIFLKTIGRSFRICDVAAKERAAAVKFEIKISFSRFRLYEELNATVFINRRAITRMHAADITVINAEYAEDAFLVI